MGTAANWKRGWRRAVTVLAIVVTAAPAIAAPPGAARWYFQPPAKGD